MTLGSLFKESGLNRVFALLLSGIFLSACASSVPSNFLYQTSLRGEQGFPGRSQRLDSATALLAKGGAVDPQAALQAALPNAEIKVKRWGLKYFGKDWQRYRVVLDADILRANAPAAETKTRCRETSAETPVGAPTLGTLLANDGEEFWQQMQGLIESCLAKQSAGN